MKKLLMLCALVCSTIMANETTPTLSYRSQGRHADRQKWVQETDKTNLYDRANRYGTLDMAVGYMASFRPKDIAKCLFGPDLICDGCDAQILVQGSNVASRDPKAWLADYLYLNCSFNGNFTIKPSIKNVLVDLDFYVGFDGVVKGSYFRIYGPICWTKWQTDFCTSTETTSTGSCVVGGVGYFTASGSETLLGNLAQYFAGDAPTRTPDGTYFQGLKYAKMPACNQTKAGFADLRAELGWNFLQNENHFVGINIQAAAPTGNRRRAEFVMEPVVGNGHHWELGAGISAGFRSHCSSHEDRSFGFYFDANITHLFKSKEGRTFDLIGKDNSRYMLAAQFTQDVIGGLGGVTATSGSPIEATLATSQFNYVYAPVANLTTANLNVSVGVQADIVAMFNFTCGKFSWDLGYNFWGRSCEKIECPNDCGCNTSLWDLSQQNTWVLKGDARMFGYAINARTVGSSTLALDTPVALSASESKATIHSGTNVTATGCTDTQHPSVNVMLQNCGVDNPLWATASNNATATTNYQFLIHTPTTFGGTTAGANDIKTSIQPVFLSSTDIQIQEVRGISNKVFTQLGYNSDRENWSPYIGIGASAEFGDHHSCCDDNSGCSTGCSNDCESCVNCALSQWAVWVKGGLAFN